MEKRKLVKSKVEGKTGKKSKSGKFSIIVKVTRAGYVPEPVTLRSKINPFMFTAEATSDAIESLEKDAAVASVSISHPIQQID